MTKAGRHEIICENCGAEVISKWKKRSCSRSCAVALAWKDPEKRKARCAGISRSKQTPKAMAQLTAHNKRRWSNPEQHRKLSEQNKREWADPVKKKKRANALKRAWKNDPSIGARLAEHRRNDWKDPEYRAKMIEGSRAWNSTPEARQVAHERMKKRWADPNQRAMWVRKLIQRTNDPEYKIRQAARMREQWANPQWRVMMLDKLKTWMTPARLAARGQKAWATRRAKVTRNDAFSKEIFACHPNLMAFGRGKLRIRNENDLEDAVQQAIMQAIAAKNQYTPGTNLKAWLMTIMRNWYFSQQRRAWRMQEFGENEEGVGFETFVPDGASNNAEASQELAEVLSVIRGGLSDEQREALMMVASGMSYEEAGKAAGVPDGTMKSRVSRARAALRAALESGGAIAEFMPAPGLARDETIAAMQIQRDAA